MCVHSNRALYTLFVTVPYSLVPPAQFSWVYARKHKYRMVRLFSKSCLLRCISETNRNVQIWMNEMAIWPLLTLSLYLIQIKKFESLKLTNSIKVKMKQSHHKLHLFTKHWTLDGNEMVYISKWVSSNVIKGLEYRSGLMKSTKIDYHS